MKILSKNAFGLILVGLIAALVYGIINNIIVIVNGYDSSLLEGSQQTLLNQCKK